MLRSVGYVVLTSVDRDDMPDGGSDHFAQTVKALKVSSFVTSNHVFKQMPCSIFGFWAIGFLAMSDFSVIFGIKHREM